MRSRWLNTATKTATVLAAAAGMMACASAQPPPELVDARQAYQRAAQGPAAQWDPASLHVAAESLQAAETSFDKHGGEPETRDLAYAATRKAQLADAMGRIKVDQNDKTKAEQEVQLTQAQIQKRTSTELASTQQQLQNERTKREAAEKRAQQAAADLAKIAAVKQEPRGMVITLSGSVLFASNQSALLPAAMAKLNEVGDALLKADPDSKITVEGYTDSQGAAQLNQDLSQRRAQSVRDYLVSRGIAADRIDSVGFGPGKPVADNTTAEGRANNRRVEIVVKPATGASGPGTTTGTP